MRDDQMLLGSHEGTLGNPHRAPPLLLPSFSSLPPHLGTLTSLGLPPYCYYPYLYGGNPTVTPGNSQSNSLSATLQGSFQSSLQGFPTFSQLPQLSALSAVSLSSLTNSLASSLLPSSSTTTSFLHSTSSTDTSPSLTMLRQSSRSPPSPDQP